MSGRFSPEAAVRRSFELEDSAAYNLIVDQDVNAIGADAKRV